MLDSQSELIKNTFSLWLESLDYEYIFFSLIIFYGVYYIKNVMWLRLKLGGKIMATWKLGLFFAIMEMIRNSASGSVENAIITIIMIFESYMILMVVTPLILPKINEYLKLINNLKK